MNENNRPDFEKDGDEFIFEGKLRRSAAERAAHADASGAAPGRAPGQETKRLGGSASSRGSGAGAVRRRENAVRRHGAGSFCGCRESIAASPSSRRTGNLCRQRCPPRKRRGRREQRAARRSPTRASHVGRERRGGSPPPNISRRRSSSQTEFFRRRRCRARRRGCRRRSQSARGKTH